jgi:hypothetical protein
MQVDLDLMLWSIVLSSAVVLGVRWLVACRPLPETEEDESVFTGHGFDSEPIHSRVDQVRQNFAAAARAVHHTTAAHEQFLAVTRQMISGLEYFRRRRPLSDQAISPPSSS